MGIDAAAEYVLTECVADAPEEVRVHVQQRFVDTLGAIAAGHHAEGVSRTTEYALATFADGDVTVLDGSGRMCLSEGAVLANAIAANALDIDEGHRQVKGHPAAIVVPAVLAAAEECDATLGEALNAMLVGYELAARSAFATYNVWEQYTGTGSWGALGAAAAVARIQGFSRNQTVRALGIAEYNAPRTPIMRFGDQPGDGVTKDGIGWGAYEGTAAAHLAKRGAAGSETLLDSEEMSQLNDLGERYFITTGYYKLYPACRWTHPGIDAAIELQNAHDISVDDIETVHVHTFDEATRIETRRPKTLDAAEYSYPFVLGIALTRGRLTPVDLEEDSRTDATVLSVADTVSLELDEELDARFPGECLARVEVTTAAETYRTEVVRPQGSVERPLDDVAHKSKQQTLLDRQLGTGTTAEICEMVSQPETSIHDLVTCWQK